MAKLIINRLALDMAGWSENDASRLSHLIADRLAMRLPDAQESLRLDNVRLNLKARTGTTVEKLADDIVDSLLLQVRATL